MPSLPPWVVMCPEASGLQMGSPHQSGARHRLQGMGDTAPPPPLGLMKTGALCGKCQKGGPSVSPCPYTTESRWRPSIAGPPRTQPRACSPLSAEQAGAGLSCEPGGGGSSPLRGVSHTKHGSASLRKLTGTDSAVRELRAAEPGDELGGVGTECPGQERGDSTLGLCYRWRPQGTPGQPDHGWGTQAQVLCAWLVYFLRGPGSWTPWPASNLPWALDAMAKACPTG